jgi:RNA polymerase sigma factor (sigma-70 family)
MTVTRPAAQQALPAATIDRADLVADLYDRHAGELYGYLVRCCLDPEPAQDLLQETFLRLVREVRAGRVPDDPRPWLYRVATNLAVSRGRRLSILSRVLRRLPHDEPAPSPEQRLLGRETHDQLRVALAQLSPKARRVLLLAAQGFRGPEIAGVIGRSELATRSLLFRSRRALRMVLARMEAEG